MKCRELLLLKHFVNIFAIKYTISGKILPDFAGNFNA